MSVRNATGLAVLTALAAMPLTLGACADNGDETPTGPPTQTSADTTADYFGTTDFIGKTVTVTGEVSRVITPTSFVLTGTRYGDDSLLVLSADGMDVRVGKEITVDGNVQKFGYPSYRDDYRLADNADAYAEFAAEEFLAVMQVD